MSEPVSIEAMIAEATAVGPLSVPAPVTPPPMLPPMPPAAAPRMALPPEFEAWIAQHPPEYQAHARAQAEERVRATTPPAPPVVTVAPSLPPPPPVVAAPVVTIPSSPPPVKLEDLPPPGGETKSGGRGRGRPAESPERKLFAAFAASNRSLNEWPAFLAAYKAIES